MREDGVSVRFLEEAREKKEGAERCACIYFGHCSGSCILRLSAKANHWHLDEVIC